MLTLQLEEHVPIGDINDLFQEILIESHSFYFLREILSLRLFYLNELHTTEDEFNSDADFSINSTCFSKLCKSAKEERSKHHDST